MFHQSPQRQYWHNGNCVRHHLYHLSPTQHHHHDHLFLAKLCSATLQCADMLLFPTRDIHWSPMSLDRWLLCCRLPEVAAAQTLAGRDDSEGPASFSGRPYVSQQQPGPSNAHFVAECFYLTQRVIHTGLMPSGAMPTLYLCPYSEDCPYWLCLFKCTSSAVASVVTLFVSGWSLSASSCYHAHVNVNVTDVLCLQLRLHTRCQQARQSCQSFMPSNGFWRQCCWCQYVPCCCSLSIPASQRHSVSAQQTAAATGR